MRKKRYRQFLLTEDELRSKSHVEWLHPAMNELSRRWRSGELAEVEVVAQYILFFLRVFRPLDYLGGPHKQDVFSAVGATERSTSDDSESLSAGVRVFARNSLRSVPLAVNRSIVGWAKGRYPLRLLDYVPSAEELLEQQAAGKRIVTCLFQPHELKSWVNNSRDPLGFALHDLIHADHFFRDAEMFAGQVEFYREVRDKMGCGEFNSILADPVRRARFEYIISDMNSHPAHLRACLAHELAQ